MDVKRYTDVDILAELSKLVDAHVQHYKEDFEYDRRAIAQAAKAELPEDRTLIFWIRYLLIFHGFMRHPLFPGESGFYPRYPRTHYPSILCGTVR